MRPSLIHHSTADGTLPQTPRPWAVVHDDGNSPLSPLEYAAADSLSGQRFGAACQDAGGQLRNHFVLLG